MTKQIPNGYKQTKVGIIPEDWEVVKIKDATSYVDYRGKTPTKTDGGIFLVTARNIKHGFIDYQISSEFIAESEYHEIMRRGMPKIGDIIITTEAPLGNIAQIDNESIALAQRVIKLRGKKNVKNDFLKHYLLSNTFQSYLHRMAIGTTVLGIQGKELHNMLISLPPVTEQEKIADILSTWDDAITKQEQLIEQKRVFKKGIMQQIFSQKIRFKDDNGNDYPAWKEHKLTKIAKTSIGLVTTMTTSYVENNGTPLIRNSDILPNNIKDNLIQLSNQFANQYNNRKLKYLDIVMVHTGDVGVSAVINKALDGCHGFATLNTRVNQETLNPFFLSFYFNSSSYISYAIKMSTGDGRCNFNLKDFDNSIIPTPVLDEQTKISDFLTQIDDEMTKQTEILDQLKLQKQSLMQKLLTGQVRTKI